MLILNISILYVQCIPQFTRTTDNGEEHAFQVEVSEGPGDSYSIEHKVYQRYG